MLKFGNNTAVSVTPFSVKSPELLELREAGEIVSDDEFTNVFATHPEFQGQLPELSFRQLALIRIFGGNVLKRAMSKNLLRETDRMLGEIATLLEEDSGYREIRSFASAKGVVAVGQGDDGISMDFGLWNIPAGRDITIQLRAAQEHRATLDSYRFTQYNSGDSTAIRLIQTGRSLAPNMGTFSLDDLPLVSNALLYNVAKAGSETAQTAQVEGNLNVQSKLLDSLY